MGFGLGLGLPWNWQHARTTKALPASGPNWRRVARRTAATPATLAQPSSMRATWLGVGLGVGVGAGVGVGVGVGLHGHRRACTCSTARAHRPYAT